MICVTCRHPTTTFDRGDRERVPGLLTRARRKIATARIPCRVPADDEPGQRLAALLARLMPAEPEVLGLLALIRLHRARAATRFDAEWRLVLPRHQDRARWNKAEIAAAAELVVRAARLRRPGPYQIQAAIIALPR